MLMKVKMTIVIVFGHLYMQSREEYQPSTVLWWYRVTDVRGMVWNCVVYTVGLLKLQSGRPPSSHLILTWTHMLGYSGFSFAFACKPPSVLLSILLRATRSRIQVSTNPKWIQESWIIQALIRKIDTCLSKLSQHVSTVKQTPMFLLKPASNDLESSNVSFLKGS